MATAQTIIDRALRLIGAIEAGESGTTDETDDGLAVLNAMIGAWIADRSNIITITTFATAATNQSLPDGYEQALIHNLAVLLAPEYGKPVPESVTKIAADTLRIIRRSDSTAGAGTANAIIDRALRLIGAVGHNESGTAEELANGLIALNAMLSSWSNNRLMTYAMTTVSKAMVAGDSSYTIVSGGDFNAARPVKVQRAYMTIDGFDHPVEVIGEAEWYSITDKTAESDPVEKVWYNPTMTSSTGTVNVWPVPTDTNTLTLVLWVPLTAFASLATTVTLPNGWDRAMAYNLAIELAPEFGKDASQTVIAIARESKADIQRINSPTMIAMPDLHGMFNQPTGNIFTGGD